VCGPALPLVAAGLAAAGTITSALSANAQARYKAKIDERNAAMEREAAQQSILNTQQDALAHYRKVAALKGAQRAQAAANGVGVDFGTAADVLGDTELLSREDVGRIYKQGQQRTRGFEIQASNDLGDASASRQAGTGALISGAFNAGGTLLGGAQQYANFGK
jgi:uncharacterized protein YfaS (alpha-2-macroglobulin family)